MIPKPRNLWEETQDAGVRVFRALVYIIISIICLSASAVILGTV